MGNVLTNLKSAYDLAQKLGNLELLEAIAQLRQDCLELREQNLDLREANARLQAQLATNTEFEWREPFYVRVVGDQIVDGPFCSRCKDVANAAVRLTFMGSQAWRCPECKTQARGAYPPSSA